MSAPRLLLLAGLMAAVLPAPAAADWLVTPYIGLKFGGETNLVDLEDAAGDTKLTLGASFSRLGDGILGLEVDFGYAPSYFQRGDGPDLVSGSAVTTLTGNVIVAVPRRLIGESLRPYVLGGVGLIHVREDYVGDVFRVNSNLLGWTVGAGAIGPLTNRTSLRFEVRRFANLSGQAEPVVGTLRARLDFWRATVGLTVRF